MSHNSNRFVLGSWVPNMPTPYSEPTPKPHPKLKPDAKPNPEPNIQLYPKPYSNS